MSLRASASLPSNCSGDMYCSVPRIVPAPVNGHSRWRIPVVDCACGLREPEIEQLDACRVTRTWRA